MKKSISNFIILLVGGVLGAIGMEKVMNGKTEQDQKLSDKYLVLFLMMNQWVKVKQEGKNLESYFEQKGYHNIAVYGMSHVGRIFVDELADSAIHIKYGIDQNTDIVCEGIDIISPEDKLKDVDAVVVTPITFFAEIEECLSRKIDCPVISLGDVLYEL